MGAYLHIGFVVKATTTLPKNLSKANFQKEVEQYYPSEVFDCAEIEAGGITLTLKSNLATIELAPFVRDIYKDWSGQIDKEAVDFNNFACCLRRGIARSNLRHGDRH